MSVTLEVSQPPIGWLKAEFPLNMLDMSVTLEVSQLPICSLNAADPRNMLDMSVTFVTSHSPIVCVQSSDTFIHESTAALSSVLFCGENTVGTLAVHTVVDIDPIKGIDENMNVNENA